jgi:hypothetical protein
MVRSSVIFPFAISHGGNEPAQEGIMAKGQMKTNKEKKKPKAEGNKVKQVSAYKAQQGGKK